jgi:hypothetical protein
MDTLKAVLRKRSLFAFSLALALAACGSDDPETTPKPGHGDNAGDGDTGDGDGDGDADTGDGDGDGDTGDGDTGDGDTGEIPDTVDLPYAVDAFHVPSGFMGQGSLMPCPITALPNAMMDDSTCGGKRAPGMPVGACHTFIYTPSTAVGADAWAGVFWTFGDGNWDLPGIKIAAGAKEIHFYARADSDVTVKFSAGMGDKSDAFHTGDDMPIALTKDWKEYSISLAGIKYTTVNGAFAWAIDNMEQTGKPPFKFYIDDIEWR